MMVDQWRMMRRRRWEGWETEGGECEVETAKSKGRGKGG